MRTFPNEPPQISSNATMWMELVINRVLDGHRVDLEFFMFPRRDDPSKIIIVDTGPSRSKDEAAFVCKIAVARVSPDEYLFASESYMLVPRDDVERRYLESVQRGDISLKDIPGREDILMFVYGNEWREYLHVVHLKTSKGKFLLTHREWITPDDETKQVGRFVGFRELQRMPQREKEN